MKKGGCAVVKNSKAQVAFVLVVGMLAGYAASSAKFIAASGRFARGG
jgi:hypothetical protein